MNIAEAKSLSQQIPLPIPAIHHKLLPLSDGRQLKNGSYYDKQVSQVSREGDYPGTSPNAGQAKCRKYKLLDAVTDKH